MMDKYEFELELDESTLKDFRDKCQWDGVTPEEVLSGFINDLVYGSRANGSDERMLARAYYDRVGYGR